MDKDVAAVTAAVRDPALSADIAGVQQDLEKMVRSHAFVICFIEPTIHSHDYIVPPAEGLRV
jgi:hypothetical protein